MATTARDVMQTQVISLAPNDPLSNVLRLFFEEEIHGAPVLDESGCLLGIITSMDLLRAASDEHETARGDPAYFRELLEFSGPDWDNAPEGFIDRLRERVVSEVMTEGVACVAPDDSISQVARVLRSHRIHRVLVVEEGRLCGIISTYDLVGLLEKRA